MQQQPNPAQNQPNQPEVEELIFEFFVFRRMIEQLPPTLRELFSNQLNKVVEAVNKRDRKLKDSVLVHVEDAILEIKAQEFDLEATRSERNALQTRLDQN